jgi:tetratricopeptide (TPR) repeat protein
MVSRLRWHYRAILCHPKRSRTISKRDFLRIRQSSLITCRRFALGSPQSSFFGFFGAMYPVYVRGLAYLAAHRGDEAAAEFQKILDHPGIVLSDPISPVVHYQLGRAYAASGEMEKATLAYHDFLTLWKDADREIPLLKEASAEYEKAQVRGATR